MSRAVRAIAASVSLLLCLPAFAEVQYWVTIGSFKEAESAQKVAAMANTNLTNSFSVVGVDTPSGYYYRVAVGPYRDIARAEDQLRQTRAAGYDGAWMWADNTEVSLAAGTADDYRLDDIGDFDLGGFEDLNLDDYDDLDALVPLPAEPSPEVQNTEVPELVEEPPENYKLNKLKRDASVWPPPETAPGDPPEIETGSPPSQLIIDVGNPTTLARFQASDINITIDGHLDAPQWRNLPGVGSFRVVDPDTETQPRYQTIVKMLYTERGLYASFEMEQSPAALDASDRAGTATG